MTQNRNREAVEAGRDSLDPQDVIVGVFDVLGFSARVASTSLEDLVADYRDLLELKLRAGQVPLIKLPYVQEWNTPSTVFSDTIVFWANAEPESVEKFLVTCSVLVADGMSRRWPLRGGIAAGKCYLDRTSRVFVGQPIVDAYHTEQCQNWVGAALHPSVTGHPRIGAIVQNHDDILQYSVPVKSGSALSLEYAVSWPMRSYDASADLDACDPGEGKLGHQKYENTRLFVAEVENRKTGT